MQGTSEPKRTRYLHVVAERKGCAACSGLANPSRIDAGRFDGDEIGPYSRWQGNLDADLMVVGQDFADVEGFRTHRGWPGERVETNRMLVELISEAGIHVSPPQFGTADDRLFFTNAVLCMKQGGMQATVPTSCFEQCGRRFLGPLIEIVSPKLVVTLGIKAAGSAGRAFGLSPAPKPPASGQLPRPIALIGNPAMLMCLYHPSRTVQNTTRSPDAQRADWREVGRVLSGLKSVTAQADDRIHQHPRIRPERAGTSEMYSYFYKLSAHPITDETPFQVEPNFECLETALERAYWHTRLAGTAHRFGYVLDERRGIIVMDAARFDRWLQYRAAARREAV